MTVPPEYSSLTSYRATLGHKVKRCQRIFTLRIFTRLTTVRGPTLSTGPTPPTPCWAAPWPCGPPRTSSRGTRCFRIALYIPIIYVSTYLYLLSIKVLCNYGYNPWQTVAIPEVETVVVRTGFNWGLFARV